MMFRPTQPLNRVLAMLCLLLLASSGASAVDVVAELVAPSCERFTIVKELRIFKDPTTLDWENVMEEDPILTTLKGEVPLMRLGASRPSKSITFLARLRALSPGRTATPLDKKGPISVIPVKICGTPGEAYLDTFGYVVESELKDAQQEERFEGSLPPSTPGRPIPKLP